MFVILDQSLLKLFLPLFESLKDQNLLALLGLFTISHRCLIEVLCAQFQGSSVLRDLIYSAERFQISNEAAWNALAVAKTNVTLIRLKSLIRNPGFGFCAVQASPCSTGAPVCLKEHPPPLSAPPKKDSGTIKELSY